MPELRVAISGHAGFIGSHLSNRLTHEGVLSVPLEHCDFEDTDRLSGKLQSVDAVVHLAAKNRAPDDELFETNVHLVRRLTEAARDCEGLHILFSSSSQRSQANVYGRSKQEGEELLAEWASRTGCPVSILVIPNVFGPGCRPFYNSVVATFAHLFAQGDEPEIHVDRELELIYVSDLVERIAQLIAQPPTGLAQIQIRPAYSRTVSGIRDDFARFMTARALDHSVPELRSELDVRLFATLQSYLNYPDYRTAPTLHQDPRGTLVEFVRHEKTGQVFFSTTRPGVVRGNHYHSRKLEKFFVVRGEAVIRLRKVGTSEVIEYRVSGNRPEVIDIPIYHVHNIQNVGNDDLFTCFWSNETYDPDDSDTFPESV